MNTRSDYLPYLAGILDGEGSIMIRKSGNRLNKDMVNHQYNGRIGIKNVNEEVIKLMKNVFRGSYHKEKRIYESKRGYKRNKLMYCYGAEHRLAIIICKELMPFLIIKKKQAKKIIELEKVKKQANKERDKSYSKGFFGKPYKKEFIDKLEELYLEVKKLNG